jgi:hypothetical protein
VIRSDVADMLRAGHSQAHIMRTLRVSHGTVKAARDWLGMPSPIVGRTRPPETLAEAFAARTEPVEGGHLRWTGARCTTGTPQLGIQGRYISGYQAAFILRYGREPVGRSLPGCDYQQCVAPDHVEDQPMREKTRALYAAVFGASA